MSAEHRRTQPGRATGGVGGTGPFSLRSRPTVWAMRRWERGCWSRRRGRNRRRRGALQLPAGVGEHGVDLPALPARPGGPHLVLQRVAAGGALLHLGGQPRRGEPAGGGDDLLGGGDLHAQVVEAAAGALYSELFSAVPAKRRPG